MSLEPFFKNYDWELKPKYTIESSCNYVFAKFYAKDLGEDFVNYLGTNPLKKQGKLLTRFLFMEHFYRVY